METMGQECTVYRTMEYLSKKWAILILHQLSRGDEWQRFSAIKNAMKEVTPKILAERLRKRGYSEAKVRENVQAEVLDVILCEATDTDIPVNEYDCSEGTPSDAVDFIERILNGEIELGPPGGVDWSGEMEEWF